MILCLICYQANQGTFCKQPKWSGYRGQASCTLGSNNAKQIGQINHDLPAALLFFPGLLAGPPLPFILFAEKPLRSALLSAVPDFENLFLPPCPNLASFFCLLTLPVSPGLLSLRDFESVSTLISSKRSSPSVTRPVSLSFRSKYMLAAACLFSGDQRTPLELLDLVQRVLLLFRSLLLLCYLYLFAKLFGIS